MSRRRRYVEEPANNDRWLISYADFITLLFAFFVVMYSISSINEGKYRVLSDSLMWAFRQTPKSMDPVQVGQPAKADIPPNRSFIQRPNVLDTPAIEVLPDERTARRGIEDAHFMGRMADELRRALAELMELDLVTVRYNHLWLEVEIRDSVLFPSGSAILQPRAVPVMKSVAAILRDYQNAVRVEGFTDDRPIDTLMYPSNWELSTARASSVVRLLVSAGVDPGRLSAQGFAEFRPVAENVTAEGRAQNRRVVLVVLADERLVNVLDARSSPAAEASPWDPEATIFREADGPGASARQDRGARADPAVAGKAPPLIAPITVLPPLQVVPPLGVDPPVTRFRSGFRGDE